jgi:hypothetical protein
MSSQYLADQLCDSKIHREIVRSCNRESLRLAVAVQDRLQRKLRDCIYRHLAVFHRPIPIKYEDDNTERGVGTCFDVSEDDSEEKGSVFSGDIGEDMFGHGPKGERRKRMTEHCDLHGEKQKKHAQATARIHDPDSVGLAFCRDVSESYCSCNVFKIGSRDNARAMYQLFTFDRLRFVYPGISSKRSLQISGRTTSHVKYTSKSSYPTCPVVYGMQWTSGSL